MSDTPRRRPSLWVEDVSLTELSLTRTASGELRCGGHLLGIEMPDDPTQCGSIDAANVRLSNGHVHVFLSRAVTVRHQFYKLFGRWSSRSITGWSIRFGNRAQLEESPRGYRWREPDRTCHLQPLDFDWALRSLARLQRGRRVVLCYRYPFCRVFGTDTPMISNGVIRVPLIRPTGAEWNRYPELAAVRGKFSEGAWPVMACSLIGRYVESDALTMELIRGSRGDSHRSGESKTARGDRQLFSSFAGLSVEELRCAGKSIFRVTRRRGDPRFVVSLPRRAVYIFRTLDDAQAWAAGALGYQEARRRSIACIIRRGTDADWTRSVRAML